MEGQQAVATKYPGADVSAVICVLLYFDIFDHPLTRKEIWECSRLQVNETELGCALDQLVQKELVFRIGEFYCLKNNPLIVEKRIKGNALADIYLKRAHLVSRFISWFPFVRGVIISGSLSKHYMDKGSDIDYFIVTEAGRLWLSRSILAAWRKLMIGPLKKYFCINYFVSTASLKIPDENLFTATELVFMYPTYGKNIYDEIVRQNRWVKKYYPNKKPLTHEVNSKTYAFSLKRLTETLLNGSFGEWLDTRLFRFMLNRWKKRYKDDFDETAFDLNIRTKRNVSKQHEKGHQFVILGKYEQQLSNFEKTHGVTLADV